jgi:hypothetical protein
MMISNVCWSSYLFFVFCCFIFLVIILTCLNFHDRIKLYLFNFLWPYSIVDSIYHWIGVSILMIIFNCYFNSDIKNTNIIQKLHIINTMDKKIYITKCLLLSTFLYLFWWASIN